MTALRVRLALTLLILQFLVIGAHQAWNDSFTLDEPFSLVSGLSAVMEGDLAINIEHPPLPKIAAVLPVLAFGDVEFDAQSFGFQEGEQVVLAMETLEANRDRIRQITALARIVPLLEGAAVGLLLALLGRRLLGPAAGLLAAALWLTSPVIVGFSHLNGLDVPAALVVIATLLAVDRVLERPTTARVATLAVTAGAALLTRAAVGLVVVVVAAAILIVATPAPRWRRSLIVGAVVLTAWAMVWGTYRAIDSGQHDPLRNPRVAELVDTSPASVPARIALAIPWPEHFDLGIRYLSDFHAQPDTGYLFGRTFEGVPYWFWPGSFVLKFTPVVVVAIVGGAFALRRVDAGRRRRVLVLTMPMLAGLVIMLAFAQRPFGVRYLLPLVPPVLLIAAPIAEFARSRRGAALLAIGVLAQLAFLWMSLPSSLSWTAPGLGPGWRTAADANVDWGQDFYRLEQWARDPDHRGALVSYYGVGPSIDLREVEGAVSAASRSGSSGVQPPPDTEWVVVSASNLNAVEHETLGVLDRYCPVEIIGSTLLAYRFDPAPSSLGANSPGPPAPACPDQRLSQRHD